MDLRIKEKKIFTFLLVLSFFATKSFALIEIDITRGNLDPLPIAVSPLHVDIKSENYKELKIKNLGEDISAIIEKNFRKFDSFLTYKAKLNTPCKTLKVLKLL